MQLEKLLGLTPDGGLNLTALRVIVEGLPPDKRRLLYAELNITDVNSILSPQHTNGFGGNTEDQLMQYEEYRIRKLLLLYIPPILLVLGTFGNVFTFIILMHPSMRKFSTYIYLAILSITDTLVLYVGLMRLWVGELTGYDLVDQADWICKLVNVVGYTVSDYSVWLIIAVTVERYVAVCYPLKAPSMCNRSRSIIIISCVLILLFIINIHFLWTTQVNFDPASGTGECQGGPNYETLVMVVWPWVDAFLYSFLPFAIILALNILIIRQVIRARKSRHQLQSNNVDTRRAGQESSTKLTVMLLTISFAFLITTLPMNISLIAAAFYNDYNKDMLIVARFNLARTVTELLMYVNHSMNFFLYCATGQKFRQQLLRLICMGVHHDQRAQEMSHTLQTQTAIRNGLKKTEETEMLTLHKYSPRPEVKSNLIAEVKKGEYVQMKVCQNY